MELINNGIIPFWLPNYHLYVIIRNMPFKIKSTVSVYEYPPEGSKAEGVNHVVLSREKLLHPGEKISVSGSVTYDIEAKGGWVNAKGEIRIIDEKTLGIRWKPTLGETLLHAAMGPETLGVRPKISETREYAKWDKERTIQLKEGDTLVELGDVYCSEPVLPEVFTLADRARIKPLTERMLRSVEGTKSVERKTELIHEP